SNPTHTYSRLATGSHTVTMQDGILCQTSPTLTIFTLPYTTLFRSKTDLTCNGVPTGTVTATFSGGTGTLQVQIDGGGYNTFTSRHTLAALASESHTESLHHADRCTTSQSSTLTQPTAVALSLAKSD